MVGAAARAVLYHLRPQNAVNSEGMKQQSAIHSKIPEGSPESPISLLGILVSLSLYCQIQ